MSSVRHALAGIIEFADIDWRSPQRVTLNQNATFACKAIARMNTLQFVERHAWFAAHPSPWGGQALQINLVDDRLRPTPVGIAFAQALRGAGSQDVAILQ